MDVDSAKLIYRASQECIKEFGALPNTLNVTLLSDSFIKVRVSIAQVMADLATTCICGLRRCKIIRFA